MAEVGAELQEQELLQAGDISRCPFLQGVMEALGTEAVHEYLQGLGSAAVAEKRAMYETVEPIDEPVERPAELPHFREQADVQTQKLPERVPTINYEVEIPPTPRLADRVAAATAATRAAAMDVPFTAPHLTDVRPAKEAEPLEAAVATAAALTTASRETERTVVNAPSFGLEEVRAEQTSETASVPLPAKGRDEPLAAHAASEHKTDEVAVPETVELMAKKAEPPAAVRVIEELLIMPEVALDEIMPQVLEQETEEMLAVEVIDPEPVPLFSKRIEITIAQTVGPERQADAVILVAKVYELAELVVAAPVHEAVDAGVSLPEQAAELERVVQRLLQALGVAEPTEEQVQRFVRLVCQEVQARTTQPEASYWLDEGMHERLQGLTATIGYWLPALAHRLLGRLALLQPVSVIH